MNIIKNIVRLLHTKSLFFWLLILSKACLLQANIEHKLPSTATNTIGSQYLTQYRKELKKLDTAIQGAVELLKNNPAANTEQSLAALYHARHTLAHFITDNDILFGRFALNELMKQESFNQLVDFSDYEHNLYVACSSLDKEKDSYKEQDHLLHQLAVHTSLKSGYVKWAKVLSMPTTDIDQLKRTQNVSKELLRNTELLEKLDTHLKQIKKQGLEDSFLSFWKDDSAAGVISNAPYATNSNFSPIIEFMLEFQKMSGGDVAQMQEAIDTLDKTPAFISAINWTTFIQDAGMIMFGVSMIDKGWENLKETALAIPKDFDYLGNWKLLAMPIILPIINKLAHMIVDQAVKNRLQQEYAKLTTLCAQNNLIKPNNQIITSSSIKLFYDDMQQARETQKLITEHMPCCQTTLDQKTLTISLTAQEERSIRFSHPLMQHKTLTTIVIPCALYLLACQIKFDAPIFSWESAFPFTQTPIPTPGFVLLPWHSIKLLTCTGLIPAYAYQHFLKIPQKSILKTTTSIQQARKALLDFAQLIHHVKQIQKILISNQILRDNLDEVEELDAEKVIQAKVTYWKNMLNKNGIANGLPRSSITRAIAYLEATQQEISQLLDTLQTHINETESTEPHNWFSPVGFVKNLNIRFGSDDLLAAYKTMLSIKDTFAPWIEALGEIDRKVSEVKLIKAFEQKAITFCFAEYEDQPLPHIAATNIWLPHLLNKTQPENIVTNNIEMGNNGLASTIILSGPTEGGKSTIERTIAIATLMAHTIGFVPATTWITTPFDRMLLSFNAADNLGKTVNNATAPENQTGTSGFRDEVESVKHIVQEKEKLGKEKKALIIIDELFQKVQRSGEYFSYHVIEQNFVSSDNSLSIIVSHREQPKYLEQETAGRCQNYHFVLQNVDGKLVNTYRIQPGALLRTEHKPVTIQEIVGNQEDAYNLQMVKDAGILKFIPQA